MVRTIVVDRACNGGFQPYLGDKTKLSDEDRVWVAGHNAYGAVYCGEKWLKK